MVLKGILITGAVLGALLVVLGGILFPVFDKIIHDEVIKQVVLSNNESVGFSEWTDPPGDIYMQFWVFTLGNKAEVMKGAKPYFIEVGPFTYRETKPKGNVTFSPDMDLVNYTSTTSYEFLPEMSSNTPDYKITTLNIPLMTVAEQLKYMPKLVQELVLNIIASALEKEVIFYEISVQDLLWGYEDPLLELLHKFDKKLVPETKFGLFVGRNGSNDGIYQVYTGKADYMKISDIRSWRGMTQLEWWTTDQANAINGSDGSYNHPFWTKDDDGYVFSSDICRSIIVKYEKDTNVKGIPTWKFSAPSYSLQNGTAYPPNAGFCLPDLDHCLPNGLLNVSKCQMGAPIVMSLPHFLFSDKEKVLDLVSGIKPDPAQHNTFFNLEPLTGGPLEVAKRIQINIFMEGFSGITQMQDLPTLTFPILWLNESAVVTDDGAASLRKSLVVPLLITTAVKWGLIALGGVLIVIVIICVISRQSSKNKSLPVKDHVVNVSNGDQCPAPATNESSPLLS